MFITGTTLDLWAHQPGAPAKGICRVTVAMNADDAFALATILLNNQEQISDDWRKAINDLAHALIEEGNKCR